MQLEALLLALNVCMNLYFVLFIVNPDDILLLRYWKTCAAASFFTLQLST